MKDRLISFYANAKDNVGTVATIGNVLDKIKGGYWLERIDKLRSETEPEIQSNLKKQMPGCTFSGTFSKRNQQSCTEYTGIICIDFDHKEDPQAIISKMAQWPHTLAAFVSPRGHGAKVLILTTANKDRHKSAYYFLKPLVQQITEETIDETGPNIDRLCFVSYDPHLYVNYEAAPLVIPAGEWTKDGAPKQPDAPKKRGRPAGSKRMRPDASAPWQDKMLFAQHVTDKEGVFAEGNRNNYINKLAFAGHCLGCTFAEIMCFIDANGYVSADFDSTEIQATVFSATDNAALSGSWYANDARRASVVATKRHKGETASQTTANPLEFWTVTENGVIKFDHSDIIYWLEEHGFARFVYPNQAYDLVKLDKNIVERTTIFQIKEYCRMYLENIGRVDVLSKLIKEEDKHLSKSKLDWLPAIDNCFVRDNEEFVHVFYSDAVAKIDMFQTQTIPYNEVGGYVWREWILARPAPAYDPVRIGGDWWEFLTHVSRDTGRLNEERRDSLAQIFGYLVSRHKDAANAKAVVLCDQRMPTMKGDANGGTGKSLFGMSLSHIRPTIILGEHELQAYVQGKTQFALQRVTSSTCLIEFNDLPPKFPFRALFGATTDDLIIERKNQPAVCIPFESSPKLLLTTNDTIPDKGSSYERRKVEFEFSDFFHPKRTPKDVFGKLFFSEWNSKEWERFDCAVINCVQRFLRDGLAKPKSINLDRRKVMDRTCVEFVEFAFPNPEYDGTGWNGFEDGKLYNAAELLSQFNETYTLDTQPTVQLFGRWLSVYAQSTNREMTRIRKGKQQLVEISFTKNET